MTCQFCSHVEHGSGPCSTCAANNTTCWQGIRIAGGDGDRGAAGVIDLATGLEQRPCMMCKHWRGEDKRKVVEHLLAHGLEARPDGCFVTPIAKDFPGRKSLVLDPRNFGWCDYEARITDAQATCTAWKPTTSLADFQRRMRRD